MIKCDKKKIVVTGRTKQILSAVMVRSLIYNRSRAEIKGDMVDLYLSLWSDIFTATRIMIERKEDGKITPAMIPCGRVKEAKKLYRERLIEEWT